MLSQKDSNHLIFLINACKYIIDIFTYICCPKLQSYGCIDGHSFLFFLRMDEIYINKSYSLLLQIFMYAYQHVEMNMTIVFVIVWPLFSSVDNNCIYNIKGDLLCPFCNRISSICLFHIKIPHRSFVIHFKYLFLGGRKNCADFVLVIHFKLTNKRRTSLNKYNFQNGSLQTVHDAKLSDLNDVREIWNVGGFVPFGLHTL